MKTLFIYGSTGDLARKKVIPALQKSNIKIKIFALGRKELKNEEYHNFICEGKCSEEFKKDLAYVENSLEEPVCNLCMNLLNKNEINFFYISLPPKMIRNALLQIKAIKEKGYKVKILAEKPFGQNLDDAKELKKFILNNNLEKEFLISDHYLFKNLIIPLKPVEFKKLKIVSLEKVGLEGRTGYYDEVGALKDMVQSHFLDILFKLIPNLNSGKIKIKEVSRKQYNNYVKDLGKKSDTETYVKIIFYFEDKEIEFETGKNFEKKENYVQIDSKKVDLGNENSYEKVFDDFFNLNEKNFISVSQTIKAWEIIEKINKEMKKEKLSFY